MVECGPRENTAAGRKTRHEKGGAIVRTVVDLTPGLPKGELIERIFLHRRRGGYSEDELAEVVRRAGERMGTPVSAEAAVAVAHRARGTPREAIRLFERARDLAVVEDESEGTENTAT